MKTSRLSCALLAVVLTFAGAGVADASAPPGRTILFLTIAAPEGSAQSVVLTCEPSGGTHPSSRMACRELRAVNGNFDSLPAHQESVACTMEYRPVVAVVSGTWRGRPLTWQREYGNRCTMHTGTGGVFRF